nr:MAG TPA: hypothetical protein [Caudoviricetes sp.]DAI02850.1 MAG TPA: hypothetical protein [Caudoviricetes sp.]
MLWYYFKLAIATAAITTTAKMPRFFSRLVIFFFLYCKTIFLVLFE